MRYLAILIVALTVSGPALAGPKAKKLVVFKIGHEVTVQTVEFKNRTQCEAARQAAGETFEVTGQRRVKHPTLLIYEQSGSKEFTLLWCG